MVSFILAMGDWTDSPWRAMDEYDVFMDTGNRRISTEMLLTFALQNPQLQLVLLTPQVGRDAGTRGRGSISLISQLQSVGQTNECTPQQC